MTDTTTLPGKPRVDSSSGASASTAPTQFIETRIETYAYRRFGGGGGVPLPMRWRAATSRCCRTPTSCST